MEKYSYKFYELYTEYGTLLIYKKRENGSFPEIRELFTNDKAFIGYGYLGFNNGKSIFKTKKRNMDGYVIEEYMNEIEPCDFLVKVEPFLSDENEKQKMIERTQNIFNLKEKNGNGTIIIPFPDPSIEEKNEIALQLLKKYIK